MPDIAVLISFSGAGGVERMVMNLVREFDRRGLKVDLLTIRASGPHLRDLPEGVRHYPLKARHTLTAIPELARYLSTEAPAALLVAKDRAGRAAALARKLSGYRDPLVVRLGTNLSTALQSKSRLSGWIRTAPMRKIYRWVDQVVAVSEGVRQDTLAITGLDPDRVVVIRNPVITPDFDRSAQSDPAHPWLQMLPGEREIPVVIAAGRLSHQKGFDTLIRAFALVSKQRQVRLLILGEGGHREKLEKLVGQMGLGNAVQLPGFQLNLYQWLRRADLFVLSSRWEGSPNVLTEALALGVPVVATRCPSGPDEILQEGRFGPLVKVDDEQGLAAAILARLDQPVDSEFLRSAADEYRAETSAEAYLKVLGVSR